MIGLSTYAFFWRWSDRVDEPLSLADMLRATADDGVGVFQICDYPPLDELTANDLADARALADDLGLVLEVGTKGTDPVVLERYLGIAEALGASLVRSMWTVGDDRPSPTEAERRVRSVLGAYAAAGVTLALETYEQVPTTDLVTLIETVASPNLGICLDPANPVANLESPVEVTRACAPYTANWHVKDFDFTRSPGWVGFVLAGAPLGTGRLDYDDIARQVQPEERGINRIVEHWLPWAGDAHTTTQLEAAWTATSITYLQEKQP